MRGLGRDAQDSRPAGANGVEVPDGRRILEIRLIPRRDGLLPDTVICRRGMNDIVCVATVRISDSVRIDRHVIPPIAVLPEQQVGLFKVAPR